MSSTQTPLFTALADSLERQIRDGAYKVGEKLPSLREIATLRNYSKNTVVAAFELLVARGLVEPRHGAGFFVKEKVTKTEPNDTPAFNGAMNIVWLMNMQLRNEPGQLTVGDAVELHPIVSH